MSGKKLQIDVWSDIVCPWCAIGKRRLEAALERFEHKDEVEVVFRAFELDPSAPAIRPGDHVSQLASKFGRTRAQIEEMIHRVVDVAAQDGLDFQLLRARSGNTFDGHRLLHMAAEHGLQGKLKDRLMRAYMTEGEAIGDRETLGRLAAEVGLDRDEIRATLESDRYGHEVREEEDAARQIGISGVPFFVLGGKLAVSGAQPTDVFTRALDQAWESASAGANPKAAEGTVCGDEGCA